MTLASIVCEVYLTYQKWEIFLLLKQLKKETRLGITGVMNIFRHDTIEFTVQFTGKTESYNYQELDYLYNIIIYIISFLATKLTCIQLLIH